MSFLLVREISCSESLLWYVYSTFLFFPPKNYSYWQFVLLSFKQTLSTNASIPGNTGHSQSEDHCRPLPHALIPQNDWLPLLVLYSCNSRSHQNTRTISVIVTKRQRKKHSKFNSTNHNNLRPVAPTPPISSCIQAILAKCICQNVTSLSN